MPTFAPWRTSACAVAFPIPRAPPVMATTFPFKLFGCFAMSLLESLWPGGQLLRQPILGTR